MFAQTKHQSQGILLPDGVTRQLSNLFTDDVILTLIATVVYFWMVIELLRIYELAIGLGIGWEKVMPLLSLTSLGPLIGILW